jgi:multicomponent K+:H+ antiporter subunit D
MMRVYTLIFGDEAGELSHMAQSWLWWLALATIVMGGIGVLASKSLRKLTANLVIVSVGTLVALVAVQTIEATASAIYYLVHSTLVTAALFLLADLIGQQRPNVYDRITAGPAIKQSRLLGCCYLIAGIAVIGMPPLSGFIGKVWLLKSTLDADYAIIFWPLYLLTSLVVLLAVSKAGSTLFWHHKANETGNDTGKTVHPAQFLALLILISAAPLMSIFAGPLSEYAIGAATQLHDFNSNINAILLKDM